MKNAAFILTLLLLPDFLAAQNPEAGFLKVVNLVSLRTPTYIRLGDFEFDNGRPVSAGDDSGTLALKPNNYTVTISNDAADPKSESVDFQIENAQNVVVMCYDETMKRKDGTLFPRLRFSTLTEAPAADKPRISIVSLLKMSTVTVAINGKSITLADRKAHRIDPEIGETIGIRFRGKNVGDFEIAGPTHYLAFLYRDPESDEIALSLIENEKLEYHPPLDDDETPETDE